MKVVNVYNGDCLAGLARLPNAIVDLVCCDLPYGTTDCAWDSVIPLAELWIQLWRVTKLNAAIVLTCCQPFTSRLVSSNYKGFKYCFAWDKVNRYTGALSANKKPMRRHEDVAVFYRKQPTYNKQLRNGSPYTATHGRHGQYIDNSGKRFAGERRTVNTGGRNPCSVLSIAADIKTEMGLHPTQKPIALMEYFIKTYSDEHQVVLDMTMGSGTTGVAAVRLGRKFIGIEKDKNYFSIAKKRIYTELDAE